MLHLAIVCVLIRLSWGQECEVGKESIEGGLIKKCVNDGGIHEDVIGCQVVDASGVTVNLTFGNEFFAESVSPTDYYGLNQKCTKEAIVTIGCYVYDVHLGNNRPIKPNANTIAEQSEDDPYVFHCVCNTTEPCRVDVDRCVVGTNRTWREHVYECVMKDGVPAEKIVGCRVASRDDANLFVEIGDTYYTQSDDEHRGFKRQCQKPSITYLGCYLYDSVVGDYVDIEKNGNLSAVEAETEIPRMYRCICDTDDVCQITWDLCVVGMNNTRDGYTYQCVQNGSEIVEILVECTVVDVHNKNITVAVHQTYLEQSTNEVLTGFIRTCGNDAYAGCYVYDENIDEFRRLKPNESVVVAVGNLVWRNWCQLCENTTNVICEIAASPSCLPGHNKTDDEYIYECIDDDYQIVACIGVDFYKKNITVGVGKPLYFETDSLYGLLWECAGDHNIGCYVYDLELKDFITIKPNETTVAATEKIEEKLMYSCQLCEDTTDHACDMVPSCVLGTQKVEYGVVSTCEKNEETGDIDFVTTGCVVDDAKQGTINISIGEQYLEADYNLYGFILKCDEDGFPSRVGCWVYDLATNTYKDMEAGDETTAAPHNADDVREYTCTKCDYEIEGEVPVCGVDTVCKEGDIKYEGNFITKCVAEELGGVIAVGCQVNTVDNATKLTNINISDTFLQPPHQDGEKFGLVGTCEEYYVTFRGCWVYDSVTKTNIKFDVGKSQVATPETEKFEYTCDSCTEEEGGDPSEACVVTPKKVDDDETGLTTGPTTGLTTGLTTEPTTTIPTTKIPNHGCNKKAKKH